MKKKGIIGVIIIVLLVLAIITIPIILSYTSVTTTTITVTDKERINDGESSYYLVFTENEVFKNSDSMLQWKFDSSDVYNDLKIGKTYIVKVNWFRIPFLSAYRNILEIK